MPTLNELTYQVLEGVRNDITDDDSIDKRLIHDIIHGQRALWLRNELNKDRHISDVFIQRLNCLPVSLVDAAECCDFSSDCKVLRTQQQIPQPIGLHNKDAIVRVGPTILTLRPYSFMTYDRALFFGNGRVNRHSKAAYLRNGYIYVVSKDPAVNLLQSISVHGIFENPTEVTDLTSCDGSPCWSVDDEYPITEWLWQYVRPEVQKILLAKLSIPSDRSNDNAPANTR